MSILWGALKSTLAMKLFTISLTGLAVVFSIATFRQLPQTVGIFSLGAQCLAPFALSVTTTLVLMSTKDVPSFLLKAFTLGAAVIAGTDFWLYCQEGFSRGYIADSDFSFIHRGFADAYIFFMPFIWVFAIVAKCRVESLPIS